MKTDDIHGTGGSAAMASSTNPCVAEYAPLLITFALSDDGGVRRVRCQGCREILPPDTPTSQHIRGTVELDGQRIPIIDVNIPACAEQTPIASSTRILIADHCSGLRHP